VPGRAVSDDGSALVGAILAGGAGSRLGGRPKGLETIGGIRIIDRVARALRGVAGELLIVSNAPDAEQWLPDARVGRDLKSGRGSLIGIHAALGHARAPVLVVAWDMPFVTVELLALIRDRAASAAHAVIPVPSSGPEPCCAWYSPTILPVIAKMIDGGELRLGALFDYLPSVEVITERQISRVGDPRRLFFNVNTPADLDASASML
jgi:molybdopterin-guanine dinucleotide biosynthesis protein A